MATQTKMDASKLVLMARVGSLAGDPSPEYLHQLRKLLLEWADNIDREIARRCTDASDETVH